MRIGTFSAGIYPGNAQEENPAARERGKRSAAHAAARTDTHEAHIREFSVQQVQESVAFLGDALGCGRVPQSRPYDAGADPRRDGDSHVRPLSWQHVRESLDHLWATLTGRDR